MIGHDGGVEVFMPEVVDAGGDVRDRITVAEDRVRQQQVVHVTAMARDVHDFVSLRGALEGFDVRELHPVVQAVPQARQQVLKEAHERG